MSTVEVNDEPNEPPLADAGPARTVKAGTKIRLNGLRSTGSGRRSALLQLEPGARKQGSSAGCQHAGTVLHGSACFREARVSI